MQEVEMELSKVLITELSNEQAIFLREKHGQRILPITIGIYEASAIQRRLTGEPVIRPQTHELLDSVIQAMGGKVEKILIRELRKLTHADYGTFLATLYIRQNSKLIEVDSRPSDAIALGVASNVPIFVAEQVLEQAAGAHTEELSAPQTVEGRVELLRNRMIKLRALMEEYAARLKDQDFLAKASPQELREHERIIKVIQNECEAIERVLKKFE